MTRDRGRAVRAGLMACACLVAAAPGCSRETLDWQDAQAADTVLAYEHFMRQHPGSTRRPAAQLRIAQLAEEGEWERASTADTPEAYAQFLGRFPAGQWAATARLRIAEAENPGNGARAASDVPTAPQVALLQLGAFSDVVAAEQGWRLLRQRHPELLAGLAYRVEAAESQGRRLFRLQAAASTPEEARERCEALRQASQPCLVVPPR